MLSGLMIADKPLVWLHGEVKTPPLSRLARVEAGVLLRRLQRGETVGLPASRPMPGIGRRCHELRITDADRIWRIVYRLDADRRRLRENDPPHTEAGSRRLSAAAPAIRYCGKRNEVNEGH